MDELLEFIRAAAQPDATPDARAKAAAACRTILTTLEGVAPSATEPSAPQPAPVAPQPAEIANLVGALRGLPPEHLLDMAIARLRAALPAGATVPNASPIKFHIVPVPPMGRSRR
jgi:hypothetical protein